MKRNLIFTLLLVFVCFSGYANLYINEVNSTGKWIEIYNSGDGDVNVGGYSVVRNNNDGKSAPATLPAGTIIASKSFLVIYNGPASSGTASSPVEGAIDCLSYGISSDKFMSAILKDSQGGVVDETFAIGNPQTVTVSGGQSWARESDGGATIVALDLTPGKSNVALPPTPSTLKIYINEVNSTGKWIEIYNDEDVIVNIGGYSVIRNNNDGKSQAITLPAGTNIESKGYVVIYQGEISAQGSDNEPSPSPVEGAIDCMTFGISSSKFMSAVLKDNQGSVVDDTFTIGNPQTVTVANGQSWARETNGAAVIVAQIPTPGIRNGEQANSVESFKNDVNKMAFVNEGLLNLPMKTSHVQLYNASGNLVLNQDVTVASVDLINLPKGFYIVKLTISGKLFVQKIAL